MSGTNYSATNVALYNLGGSGDNMIPDGYIRAVEKVWLDTYVWTGSAGCLGTSDTVLIGVIPANKKIIDVKVVLPTTYAPTTATVSVGVSSVTGSSTFISAWNFVQGYTASINVSPVSTTGFYVTTQSTLAVSGGAAVVQAMTNIYLSVGTTAMTTPTAGTIATIIRYT